MASLDGGNVLLDFVDTDVPDDATHLPLSKRYLRGPAVDQVLAEKDVVETLSSDSRAVWPLRDYLGAARDLAAQAGTVAEHYAYDSHDSITAGDMTRTRDPFTAQKLDAATGTQ